MIYLACNPCMRADGQTTLWLKPDSDAMTYRVACNSKTTRQTRHFATHNCRENRPFSFLLHPWEKERKTPEAWYQKKLRHHSPVTHASPCRLLLVNSPPRCMKPAFACAPCPLPSHTYSQLKLGAAISATDPSLRSRPLSPNPTRLPSVNKPAA